MGSISLTKSLAVVDDISFGMGTIEQERLGEVGVYEQVNSSHIPYNNTQSIKDKIDLMVSGNDSSYISALNSEASRRTSESYATQPYGEEVRQCVSNGDGSFTYIPLAGIYSALHYEASANNSLDIQRWQAEAARMTAESYADEDTDVIVYTSNGDGTYNETVQTGVNSAKVSASKSIDAKEILESVTGGLRTDNVFVATSGQTSVNVDYNIGMADVYVEGIKLIKDVDFTADNGTSIEFTSALSAGDDINVVAWGSVIFAGFSTIEW